MTGSPSGIWFRRDDAPIRTRTNWLLSRLIFYFSDGFARGQTLRRTLPEKFENISLCMSGANPLGDCHFKTEWQYLIHEIRRDGRDVVFLLRLSSTARISSSGTVCQGCFGRCYSHRKYLHDHLCRRQEGSGRRFGDSRFSA